jgi:hypothetical protein
LSTALTLFFIAAALVFFLGTVVTIAGMARAPLGHEDSDGFHVLHSADALPEPGPSAWVAAPAPVARLGSRPERTGDDETQNPFGALMG